MPSNEQRRQAAKRKLERQIARRAERAKKRRMVGVSVTVGLVIVLVAGIYLLTTLGPDDPDATANPSEETETTDEPEQANTTDGPCAYAESAGEQSPDEQAGMPKDPDPTPDSGKVRVAVKTNQGEIPLTLSRADAPCTVQSMEHLATSGFFDGSNCHRMTDSKSLKVLQCGDPTGSGSGGPGYTIPDEFESASKLEDGDQGTKTYPRGTLAMANTGQPNTGGSQFFLVFGDSQLPPQYTVFGQVDKPGLAVLDKIADGGITPGTNPQTGEKTKEDGAPKQQVTIKSTKVR